MPSYEGFEVVEHACGVTEIRLKEHTVSDAEFQHRLANELVALVQETQPAKLVINFRDLGKCTTGAINGLLAIHKLMGPDSACIRICEVGDDVFQTLKVLNLTGSLFAVYESLDDAIVAV